MSEKRIKRNKSIKRLLGNLLLDIGLDEQDISFLKRNPKVLDNHIHARKELFRKYPDLMKLI